MAMMGAKSVDCHRATVVERADAFAAQSRIARKSQAAIGVIVCACEPAILGTPVWRSAVSV
jgi:hypothetical protein